MYKIKAIVKTEDLQKVLTVFIGMPGIQVLVDEGTSVLIGPDVRRFETAVETVVRIVELSPASQAWFEPA